MKHLKLILLFTLYIVLITSCRKKEPEIDKGRQATTDAEMMQMIVGEWMFRNKEKGGPSHNADYWIKEFNTDSTYRYGSTTDENYKGGGIIEGGDSEYSLNFTDSAYYKIQNGELYRWTNYRDSLGDIQRDYIHTTSTEIEVYENILKIQEGAYSREYERL